MTPCLSIIVPNYNHALLLDECLDSIMGQTYRDFEILVADDGSNDGSQDVIFRWGERYPEFIRPCLSKVNLGVPGNIHRAIEQSRGRVLTTLDADDYYCDADKLRREMAVWDARVTAGQEGIVFSDIQLVRQDRSTICRNSDYAPIRDGNILPDVLSRSCLIPRDFIMSRQAYFSVGGYDPAVLLYDDWDLKIRLAERYPFWFSGGLGTAYRQHGHGIASRPWTDHLVWLERVFSNNLPRAAADLHPSIHADFERFMDDIRSRSRKAAEQGENVMEEGPTT